MKNFFKILMLTLVVAAFTSCQGKGAMGNGVADSVANHPDSGASTTVDTLPKTVDTTKTDTAQK